VKERELRAQLEKQTHRKLVKARGDARERANAATVAHLADSQTDLGIVADPSSETRRSERSSSGSARPSAGLPTPVTLRRRDETSAEIEAGPLRMKVALADITAVVGNRRASEAFSSARRHRAHPVPAEPASEEINLIGCTVEEAHAAWTNFLIKRALAGSSQVRLIHGHGTGALRRGLAEFLKTHPLVEAIRSEAEDRGGAAITVVVLKD